MNNYPFFRYVPGNSKLHNLNSKMKILSLIISIISIFAIKNYISLMILLIFFVYLIFKSKINLKAYIYNLLLLWPLYVMIFVITFLLTLNAYKSILIILKLVCFVLVMLLLTFTTSLSEIAWGFECLFDKLKKIKFPVSKVSLSIAMFIKFISNLFDEYKQIRKSMAYKGFEIGKKNVKTAKNIMLPTLILSYRLSKTTLAAMKLRFYGNTKKRTNYHDNKVTNFDKFLVVINCIILYVVIYIGIKVG